MTLNLPRHNADTADNDQQGPCCEQGDAHATRLHRVVRRRDKRHAKNSHSAAKRSPIGKSMRFVGPALNAHRKRTDGDRTVLRR